MNVVLVALGLVVLLVAQGIYYSVMWWGQRRRDALHARLRSVASQQGGTLLRDRRLSRSPRLAEVLRSLGFPARLEKLLVQTDIDTTVDVLLGIGLLIGLGFAVPCSLLTGNVLASIALGLPLGMAMPILYVLSARARRVRKISTQLPDALDMMVRSLRAGHGVAAGLKLVATEMPLPIAVEFGRCNEELQVGGDLRDAVRNMTIRVPGNLDLRIFATSLIIQHETGGNLVEILETIAQTVRERLKFFGKLRALTTEVRMSGYVLGALPLVCAAALASLNPTYLEPLYLDPLGRMITVIGLALWISGGFWMRRLSQVDY